MQHWSAVDCFFRALSSTGHSVLFVQVVSRLKAWPSSSGRGSEDLRDSHRVNGSGEFDDHTIANDAYAPRLNRFVHTFDAARFNSISSRPCTFYDKYTTYTCIFSEKYYIYDIKTVEVKTVLRGSVQFLWRTATIASRKHCSLSYRRLVVTNRRCHSTALRKRANFLAADRS